MKRVFLAAPLSLALLTVPATGQTTFGMVGGLVRAEAEVSSDDISLSFDARTGFAVGVSMQRAISPTLSFAPEVLYVTKGFEIGVEGDEFGLKFGYLEVPLLVRASLGQQGASARPWVAAGPAVAFKVSCDASATFEDVEAETGCNDVEDEDEPAEFRAIDFGMMFGAGIDFGRLGISVRYDLGLANILDSTEDVAYKNRALMLLGSVRF